MPTVVEQAPSQPSNLLNMADRERRVTLAEARQLQQTGHYLVHWRPNTALPELNQYATVRPA